MSITSIFFLSLWRFLAFLNFHSYFLSFLSFFEFGFIQIWATHNSHQLLTSPIPAATQFCVLSTHFYSHSLLHFLCCSIHLFLWRSRLSTSYPRDPGNADGPKGHSLYCLNLNCRAPPGRFFRSDLSFRWAILCASSYIDSTCFGLFRMPHRAGVMFST